ncbi:hypothetical protein SAPIO_CDS9923 [Scedosporium apiospermum]|uniref:Uncharacterized protein n=1 Tax=Pseudallescheria apiosperma TaxID=563466 RepID=A0A084FVZ0_PSEDA|nr:uncharacterized protein SAPIO_CDS9923 [Scedosporium apiospermum]KEZ39252.1 hypothetical protein SAPIO_CDS9923 [Scedosporium apiospermum]
MYKSKSTVSNNLRSYSRVARGQKSSLAGLSYVSERSIAEGFRSPAHPKVANLDFEARVPVPFSVFPSTYREADTQTNVATTTTTTTHEEVEFTPPKPGREGQHSSGFHEVGQEEVHYTREEDYHRRPGIKQERERHYYTQDEFRPSRPDFAETRVEVDHHHHYTASPVDIAEREYRSRVQPSYAIEGAHYRPVQHTTTTRVEEYTVEPSKPSRVYRESDRAYISKETVEPRRLTTTKKAKMGYYDEDGHYHSFRAGLHKLADKVVHPESRHHHHHVEQEREVRVTRAPRAPRQEGAPLVPNTVTIPCHHIRIGDFLMLQGRPCQVIRISTSAATGQYRYLGVDLFTKALHEESSFISHPAPSVVVQTMLGPVFKQYRVLDIQDGAIVAMTETGDVKQDLPIIDQSNLWDRLQAAFDSGRGSVRVLVLNDGGRELGVDFKVVHGSRL